MKKIGFGLLLALALLTTAATADYPEKPITIVVHSKPGGAIDLTARMLARVAMKYVEVPLVVENKYGGSGAVAMRTILSRTADGYTILGFPAAFLSTMQITQSGVNLDDFYFLACMIIAPEVIITNKQTQVVTLEQIIADARHKEGKQIWVGPGVGGLDHLMAVKTWEKLEISATWIPYNGGGESIAALLGGHGVVYVGNPEDLRGRPDLAIAASATDKRLPGYSDVPTFIEKGYNLADEVMWRGFAVKKGTSPVVLRYLVDLLHKISRDKDWLAFVTANSAEAVFIENAAFTERIKRESQQVRKYLSKAGILPEKDRRKQSSMWLVLAALVAVVASAIAIGLRLCQQKLTGELVIIAATVVLAIFFYYLTFSFPKLSKAEIVSTATVPRLWSLVLLFSGLQGIYLALRGKLKTCEKQPGSVGRAITMCAILIAYVSLLEITGFFATTCALILSGIYVMGYRRHLIAVVVTALVLAFMYVAFIRILQVPLPTGNLW